MKQTKKTGRSNADPADEMIVHEYAGYYYDPRIHQFVYLSEEDAAELVGEDLV